MTAPELTPPLVVVDGDDRIELYALAHGGPFPDRACPCGGRVIIAADETALGRRLSEAPLLVLLHSAPTCPTVRALGVLEALRYVVTGHAEAAPPILPRPRDG